MYDQVQVTISSTMYEQANALGIVENKATSGYALLISDAYAVFQDVGGSRLPVAPTIQAHIIRQVGIHGQAPKLKGI
jgi:hypothetical protein